MTPADANGERGNICRRHVFYIAGYDPQGVAGYHGLFRRELARFARVWSVDTRLGPAETDADGIAARWQVEAIAPNWQVSTTYEMLRWDDLIAADMAQPKRHRLPRAAALYFNNLFNGVIWRLLRVSWRFGVFYLYPAVALLLLGLIPLAAGWAAARVVFAFIPSVSLALLDGILAVGLVWAMGVKIARAWYVFHLVDAWLWVDDWVKGRKPAFSERVDALAMRVIARARQGGVDEIVVIGHSGGAAVCVPLAARALELDPDFARQVPRFTVIALGTLIPLLGFYPRGGQMREAVRRLASEPSVAYVDCQARKDVMNVYCDPMQAAGVPVADRNNSQVWKLRFRDMLAPGVYARLRWNFFRMHFQFIMAGDRRAPYEYFMLVCGPVPAAEWVTHGADLVKAFAPDGTFARVSPPPAA